MSRSVELSSPTKLAPASCKHRATSSSSNSSCPRVIFSRNVPLKIHGSWKTVPTVLYNSLLENCRASVPLIITTPVSGLNNPSVSFTSDVFPEPVLPITATFSPRFIDRLRPVNRGGALSDSLNITFEISISFPDEIFMLSDCSTVAMRGADKKLLRF